MGFNIACVPGPLLISKDGLYRQVSLHMLEGLCGCVEVPICIDVHRGVLFVYEKIVVFLLLGLTGVAVSI